MRIQSNRTGRKKAQALVEWALVLPIVTFIILGTMDMAWYLMERAKLDMALDRAASLGNVGIHDEYVNSPHCPKCRLNAFFIDIPTAGTYEEDYLPGAGAVARNAAVEFINLSGGKQNLTVRVFYTFSADGRGQLRLNGSFDLPGLVRAFPFPSSVHYDRSSVRELELFARE